MSRSRNIKPGFFKNDILAELPFEYRILFQGLWCEADREGRLEDRAKRLKAEIFPYDSVDIEAGLDALYAAGFIVRYEVDGEEYIEITAFSKHQSPHYKEVDSEIPPSSSGVLRPISVINSIMDQPCLNVDSCLDQHQLNDDTTLSQPCPLIPDSLNLIPDTGLAGSSDPAPQRPGRKKAEAVTLQTFIESCRTDGEPAIPEDGPVFVYAEKIGLPESFVVLEWWWFKAKYGPDGKDCRNRQKDWRGHFLNAVKGAWGSLWAISREGSYYLTSVGKQAEREMLVEEST